MRQMALIGFLQAQNCTNFASSWRHPDSRTDFLSADYYQEIGRILEAGKFDLGFFDDRLFAVYAQLEGVDDFGAVRRGLQETLGLPKISLEARGGLTVYSWSRGETRIFGPGFSGGAPGISAFGATEGLAAAYAGARRLARLRRRMPACA